MGTNVSVIQADALEVAVDYKKLLTEPHTSIDKKVEKVEVNNISLDTKEKTMPAIFFPLDGKEPPKMDFSVIPEGNDKIEVANSVRIDYSKNLNKPIPEVHSYGSENSETVRIEFESNREQMSASAT